MNMVNAGEVAQVAIIERWQWWQEALKDPAKIGSDELQIHTNEYQLGYYRCRRKDSPWEPVGIYPDEDGVVVGLRNGKPVSDIQELFLWACRHPISYEAYIKALEGGGFDDEPEKVRGIGDNSGEADPFDALTIEYLGEKEMIEEFMKTPIKNFNREQAEERASKIAIWADRLKKIKSKAVAFHKVEKQPFLDGGRAVDEKWRGLKENPDADLERMRTYVAPHFAEKKREEEKRQRLARERAEQERRKAEEKLRAAREAAANADEGDLAAEKARQDALDAARLAKEAEKEAEARKISTGRTGARMSYKTENVAVVTDYLKAATALLALNNADLKAEIDRLAKKLMKAGVPLDGVEVHEQEVVR